MRELLRLPYDPKGYGHFGVSYIGLECQIHFQYEKDNTCNIGKISFDFCINFLVNGVLNNQKPISYDTIFWEKFDNNKYEGFNRYTFMFSGSDFQFEVIAQNCIFLESTAKSHLIQDD